MPHRVPWTERTFNFDFPADLFPEMIERVRGTPARVEELCEGLTADLLKRRDGETWSIQENIGHLADLDESLFMGRLDDYEAATETLRPADMTNKLTHGANHNDRAIDDVLGAFRAGRERIVARLDALPAEAFARTALHPRLNTPMRLVDMLLFKAEHDDYHVARMRELLRVFSAER